jgi:hypothetical protein
MVILREGALGEPISIYHQPMYLAYSVTYAENIQQGFNYPHIIIT